MLVVSPPKFVADTKLIYDYNFLTPLINVPTTRKGQQCSDKFSIWNVLIVKWQSCQFSTKFEKDLSVVFTSERDISCYIFQNLRPTKLIVTHEKIPDTQHIYGKKFQDYPE